jgi:hypothetical protein
MLSNTFGIVCRLPLLKVVITGLDPVIHAFWRADPGGGEGVDGRIKSDQVRA